MDEKMESFRTGSGEASTSAGNSSEPKTSTKDGKDSDPSGNGNVFECNICLDTPTDPVVSFCGHLFCWACLHGWLEMKPRGQQTCPVCKAAVDRDKVVPLYGRNSRQEDPRKKAVPPRPNARRTEAPNDGGHMGGADFPFPGFTMGNPGFHMTLGFGALPFALFGSVLNLTGVQNAEVRDQGLISRIFLWLAVILIIWVIFY